MGFGIYSRAFISRSDLIPISEFQLETLNRPENVSVLARVMSASFKVVQNVRISYNNGTDAQKFAFQQKPALQGK